MKFGFIVYPQVQLMDIVGPLEVLNMWKMLNTDIEILFIAENTTPIDCGSNFTLKIDFDFKTCPKLDYLFVPGGMGRLKEMHNPNILNFIKKQYINCKRVAAICTGAFLLYKAGILTNHEITTYWRAMPELMDINELKIKEERFVKSGKIWTSGGISSGIDLMFELINDIAGSEAAGQVQLLFEYFPRQRIFCNMDNTKGLPNYPTSNLHNLNYLPEYIRKHIK